MRIFIRCAHTHTARIPQDDDQATAFMAEVLGFRFPVLANLVVAIMVTYLVLAYISSALLLF